TSSDMNVVCCVSTHCLSLFFFNQPSTPEIYTLSLHDALPIYGQRIVAVKGPRSQRLSAHFGPGYELVWLPAAGGATTRIAPYDGDRKSTRLNSSHVSISYAVFCLKKKKFISHRFTI